MQLPSNHPETKPFHRVWNMLLDYLRSRDLQSSDDILVTQNSHGTSLKLVKKATPKATSTTTTGGGFYGEFNQSNAYTGGSIVILSTTTVFSSGSVSVTSPAGWYALNPSMSYVTGSSDMNMYPQFPEPTTGSVYWRFMNFLPVAASVCPNGSHVYVPASSTF